MTKDPSERPDSDVDEMRRRFVRGLAAAPFIFAVPSLLVMQGCVTNGPSEPAAGSTANPTPACVDDDDEDATPSQTEGPYFTPSSPERRSLIESGMTGTSLTIAGSVLTLNCRPIANALVDFWQADDDGNYDNQGYRLRGHQYTDANGGYRLETIVPGLYPGRTRHIHVKVQAPGGRILTTQLYFPGEARNAGDGIFRSELLMAVEASGSGQAATFNFVLDQA